MLLFHFKFWFLFLAYGENSTKNHKLSLKDFARLGKLKIREENILRMKIRANDIYPSMIYDQHRCL